MQSIKLTPSSPLTKPTKSITTDSRVRRSGDCPRRLWNAGDRIAVVSIAQNVTFSTDRIPVTIVPNQPTPRTATEVALAGTVPGAANGDSSEELHNLRNQNPCVAAGTVPVSARVTEFPPESCNPANPNNR